jgi:hypothetical protein
MNAVLCGHMDVLVWAAKRRCPWDADACTAAASLGHSAPRRWSNPDDASGDLEDELDEED